MDESDNEELDAGYDMLDSDLDDDELKLHHHRSDGGSDTPTSTAPSTPPATARVPRCRQKIHHCPIKGCKKVFDRKVRLQDHIRSHNNERNFKCQYPGCTKTFLRDSHLKHHVKNQHTEIRDYHCSWDGCDKSFTTGTRLRRHISTHEAKEQFRCRGYTGCDKTFRKQETLERHILADHQNIKPFSCDHVDPNTAIPCDKAYDTAESLRSHVRAKHEATESRFSCEECRASNLEILANSEGQDDRQVRTTQFASYSELQLHNDKFHPPTCAYCPTSFGTKKELTRHMEVQHGIIANDEKNNNRKRGEFPCTFLGCGKNFTKRGNLNVHIKTVHENERAFVCGKTELALPEEYSGEGSAQAGDTSVVYGCNRSFTSKASLEEHVRTAHLNLPSKRMVREKKRKATEENDHDAEEAGFSTIAQESKKHRKTRSDKGIRRTSAMAGLTGLRDPVPIEVQDGRFPFGFGDDEENNDGRGLVGSMDPPTFNPSANAALISSPQRRISTNPECIESPRSRLSSLPSDTFLDSSMTIFGDQIFHNGAAYHFPSGQYPTLSDHEESLSQDFMRRASFTVDDATRDSKTIPHEEVTDTEIMDATLLDHATIQSNQVNITHPTGPRVSTGIDGSQEEEDEALHFFGHFEQHVEEALIFDEDEDGNNVAEFFTTPSAYPAL